VNRIGVDIGGTHTDVVIVEDGQVRLHKVPSSNQEPSEAVRRGVAEAGVALTETALFAHGTTVATNAVLQRRGARSGLLTTRGFRDVLQIRRTTRGELYDFQWDPPDELVPRRWRSEVRERIDAAGQVLVPIDLDDAVDQVRALLADGIDSLAVAFINSYRNPAQELAVQQRLAVEFPHLLVYLSSDQLPAWREFERTSTAVVASYVGPILRDYLQRMGGSLAEAGYKYDLLVMQSNGGLGTADSSALKPVSTLMSGPAAGVIAQVAIGAAAGIDTLVGMDVGGTSTDISVVLEGTAQMRQEFEIEFGTVVGFPMIDIHSIAAGGGTVAWLDDGGLLHSGPRSAGAQPGPACYGCGGSEPTLTDAYVVTGRLNPTHLLGGSMGIYATLARDAVRDLGARCGLDMTGMAAGIIALTVTNISAAIRQMTVERGINPRELTLVAYGGGGPTLGCDVAADLDIPQVLIPRYPGLTSAAGLLLTDVRHDFQHTVLQRNDQCPANTISQAFDTLVARGANKLAAEGIDADQHRFALAADLRYVGQTHELTVQLGTSYDEELHATLSERLRVDHLAQFGHAPTGIQPVEIVSVRVAAFGQVTRPDFGAASDAPPPQPRHTRQLFHDRTWWPAPVYDRDTLGRGWSTEGPAIIDQLDTTTVVLPGWSVQVDDSGALLLRSGQAATC
jgi:N-methylhydantoinase A